MKFGNSVADIFIMKHTQFGKDAFGLHNSTVHCLGVQFFRGHSVDPQPWENKECENCKMWESASSTKYDKRQ